MADIKGVRCTLVICTDLWVAGIVRIPKMLGAQVCLYPHASGPVARDREDWSALYYTRAWEGRMFLVVADCSRPEGEPFTRPATVPYPYDFTLHQLNHSCIIHPAPKYLARATSDEVDGILLADIDPRRRKAPAKMQRYSRHRPWKDILRFYEENGFVKWME